MILLTLLLQSQFTLPIPVENGPTVVVTADSLTQTKKALDDCLAHRCPPKEDIARSLAYAEMQFLTGNYQGSYRTLLSSRGRNGRYDSMLPKEVADLDRASDGAVRTDSLLVGDLFLRLGIARTAEVFAEWTPHGTLWTRVPGRPVARTTGMGDVTVGTKINLAHPDGSGLSLAVAPFAGLPVGDRDFGAGEWNYGVQVPASYALSGTLSLQLTTEFDMAADRDGRGRHPAYSMVGGVGAAIAHGLSATVELGMGRDHDPEDTTVQTVAAASVGYMPSPRLQLDAGTVLGLGGPASDLRLYVGISRLF